LHAYQLVLLLRSLRRLFLFPLGLCDSQVSLLLFVVRFLLCECRLCLFFLRLDDRLGGFCQCGSQVELQTSGHGKKDHQAESHHTGGNLQKLHATNATFAFVFCLDQERSSLIV